VLLLYYTRRLWAVFVTNDTVPPVERPAIDDRVPCWVQWTTKTVLVGSVLVSSIVAMKPATEPRSGGATAAIDGSWVVTAFAADSADADRARWLRFVVNSGGVMMRRANDTTLFCRGAGDSDPHGLSLACGSRHKGEIRWSRAGDTLQVSGTFDGTPVHLAARALHPSEDYRLLSRKFRWIDD